MLTNVKITGARDSADPAAAVTLIMESTSLGRSESQSLVDAVLAGHTIELTPRADAENVRAKLKLLGFFVI